eukprot:GFKZ01001099.1.p1 GENE.GFKZ01001099.1~~GFKZ01001099.1.p1  ORF type:complete len:403 (+),score=55.74 GFKZ01001099.1:91-1209(+)
MLDNFCNETAPRHVRDFYLARLYRGNPSPNPPPTNLPPDSQYPPVDTSSPRLVTSSSGTDSNMDHYPTHTSLAHAVSPNRPADIRIQTLSVDERDDRYVSSSSSSAALGPVSRGRMRGDDGRFVPRADDPPVIDPRDRKVCGWCGTTTTSQWRVGPTNGSVEMGTLCNACGINYRRALAKSPAGSLNLDRLAEQMGHTRLSIQKALKKQRKLSAPPQLKRGRVGAAARYGSNAGNMALRFRGNTGQARLNMLLREEDRMGGMAAEHVADGSAVGRAPVATEGHYVGGRTGGVYGADRGRGGYETGAERGNGSIGGYGVSGTGEYRVADMTGRGGVAGGQGVREGDGRGVSGGMSRLPPFQAFIGDLERRTGM